MKALVHVETSWPCPPPPSSPALRFVCGVCLYPHVSRPSRPYLLVCFFVSGAISSPADRRGNTGALLKSFLRRFVRLHGMIFSGKAEVLLVQQCYVAEQCCCSPSGSLRTCSLEVDALGPPARLLVFLRVCVLGGGQQHVVAIYEQV